jgi:hypothetical protein
MVATKGLSFNGVLSTVPSLSFHVGLTTIPVRREWGRVVIVVVVVAAVAVAHGPIKRFIGFLVCVVFPYV